MKDLKTLDRVANSLEPLEDLNILEYAYCSKVRKLYNQYKDGELTLERCKTLKGDISKEVLQYEKSKEKSKGVYEKYQESVKLSELLRAEVNKSESVTDMLAKCLEIVSLVTGDTAFLNTNIKKLGGTQSGKETF